MEEFLACFIGISIVPTIVVTVLLNVFLEEQLGGYATITGLLGTPVALFALFLIVYLIGYIISECDIKNSLIVKGLCMIFSGLVNLVVGAVEGICNFATFVINSIKNAILFSAKIVKSFFVRIADMIMDFDFRGAFCKVKRNLPHIILAFGTFSIIFAISRNHLLEMSKDFIGLFTQSQELVNILGYLAFAIMGLSLFTGLIFASEKILRPVSNVLTHHHHYEQEIQQPSRTASSY
jgi:hypothetical protein